MELYSTSIGYLRSGEPVYYPDDIYNIFGSIAIFIRFYAVEATRL
jgi:hypothetical protein